VPAAGYRSGFAVRAGESSSWACPGAPHCCFPCAACPLAAAERAGSGPQCPQPPPPLKPGRVPRRPPHLGFFRVDVYCSMIFCTERWISSALILPGGTEQRDLSRAGSGGGTRSHSEPPAPGLTHVPEDALVPQDIGVGARAGEGSRPRAAPRHPRARDVEEGVHLRRRAGGGRQRRHPRRGAPQGAAAASPCPGCARGRAEARWQEKYARVTVHVQKKAERARPRGLAAVPRDSGGVSFSGDIPAPPGQGPLQPALGDPAWAGGWAG